MEVKVTLQLKKDNRLNIPRHVRDAVNIKPGDWIDLIIRKTKTEAAEDVPK